MRRSALLAALLCLAPVDDPARAQAPAAEQPLEDLVSVDFRDVPLSQVVNALIYRRNVNILSPPEMNQRVTVKLEAVPWKSALQTILANFGYGLEEIDGIIRIDQQANLNKTLLTRNYELKHLEAEGVQRYLAPVLTRPDAARLVESGPGDALKRVLVVTDVPGAHTRMEQALREFDRPTIEGAREVVGPDKDGAMAVRFEGTRLADAVAAIAARLRLSVAWETKPTGTVDLQVRNLDLERILDLLILPRKMLYEFDDRLIRIGPADTFRPRTVTRTFTLKYANAIELQRLIKSRMTPLGRVEFLISTYGTQAPVTGPVVGATLPGQAIQVPTLQVQNPQQVQQVNQTAVGGNQVQPGQITGTAGAKEQPTISRSFVVTDTLQVMRDLEKIVKLADVPPSQVGIDVQLVEVQLTRNDQLGIQWNLAMSGNGAATGSPFPFNSVPLNQPPEGTPFTRTGNTFQFGTVSFQNFQYLLQALAQNNRLRTLSKPSVTTLDQQEATILVGERFPLVTTTQDQFGRQTFSQSGEVQIGIQLRVVPQIMDRRHISLNIHPQVSNRGDLIQNQFPVVQTREVNTQLMVKQGDTAVIAGLIQDRDNRTRQGIPGLMNLGVIGHLFGRRGYERIKSELMIFVTPRIIAYHPGPPGGAQ